MPVIIKVDYSEKSPMHICLFGHAMHKTTLLIIIFCCIFEILSRKVTVVYLYLYVMADQALEEPYIAFCRQKMLMLPCIWLSF